MGSKHKILIVSVVLAASVWVLDATLDYAFSERGAFSAWLLADMSSHHNFLMRAVAMEAESGTGQLDIKATRVDDRIQIEIQDNGPGIADLAHLFDAFYTTKEPGKGIGLGLSVSHGIITDHGGTISAANTGPGALFRVTLPATPPPEEEPKQ